MYLKSTNDHWLFVSEGEIYVEEGINLKTPFSQKSKCFICLFRKVNQKSFDPYFYSSFYSNAFKLIGLCKL